MKIDVHPLPFSGFSRSLKLVARESELGAISEAFARRSAEVLAESIARCLPDLSPDHYLVEI